MGKTCDKLRASSITSQIRYTLYSVEVVDFHILWYSAVQFVPAYTIVWYQSVEKIILFQDYYKIVKMGFICKNLSKVKSGKGPSEDIRTRLFIQKDFHATTLAHPWFPEIYTNVQGCTLFCATVTIIQFFWILHYCRQNLSRPLESKP